jgi:hypothetical protein
MDSLQVEEEYIVGLFEEFKSIRATLHGGVLAASWSMKHGFDMSEWVSFMEKPLRYFDFTQFLMERGIVSLFAVLVALGFGPYLMVCLVFGKEPSVSVLLIVGVFALVVPAMFIPLTMKWKQKFMWHVELLEAFVVDWNKFVRYFLDNGNAKLQTKELDSWKRWANYKLDKFAFEKVRAEHGLQIYQDDPVLKKRYTDANCKWNDVFRLALASAAKFGLHSGKFELHFTRGLIDYEIWFEREGFPVDYQI